MTSVAYGIVMPASRGVLGRPELLLLNKISAAPTAAFATFKLRAAYAGSCLRVRRSSDNAEQDIGFSGRGEDTASLLTFVGANDGFASKLYDQSGNARDLAQATAANQPKAVSAGSLVTVNSNPAERFDGSTSYLAGPAISNYVSQTGFTAISLFRASAVDTDANGYLLPSSITATAGAQLWHSVGLTKVGLGMYDNSLGNVEKTFSVSFPNTFVAVSSFDGSTFKAWLNGGAASTASATALRPLYTSSPLAIGISSSSARYLNGHVQAVLLFNSAISLTDINIIGAALADYGGATWTTAT